MGNNNQMSNTLVCKYNGEAVVVVNI